MPRERYNFLSKNYDYHINRQTPQEKIEFLEKTLLKRKSLFVVSGVEKKRQLKASSKKQKKNMKGKMQAGSVQCPVYKCFKECSDDSALMQHYNEAHNDLRQLGLELFSDPSIKGNTAIKGKVTNNLMTQIMMIALLQKNQVKNVMKQLNEEHAPTFE